MSRDRFVKPYMWVVVAAGAAACLDAALRLRSSHLDLKFLLLALVTVALGSRVAVKIPRISSSITVSDTFIFLIMLLYGGAPAVLVAGAEAFCYSARSRVRLRTAAFNASMLAVSTFLTAHVWEQFVGRERSLLLTGAHVLALCLMVLAQFTVNSGLAAVCEALKTGAPVFATWRRGYLWTSVTYVAGASGAAIIAGLVEALGFYSIVFTLPVIGTLYFTYRTYLRQIEIAEEQARQARLHVEELNRYIAEQERIREQFVQVEKMSALGQLASGVAHDFNNCLTAILGRAQLLARRADDPATKRGLEIIIKSAEGGARTVKRIQDFARQRHARDFQRVDVDQLLLDVAEMTSPRWKDAAEAAGASVRLELDNRSRATVLGDDAELRDVLVNMIFNALDAMPAGGTLALSSSVERGEIVVIAVRDTGAGMPEEVRGRVFDPFFTTKGAGGMGLGLAVSYGVVLRHGGNIEVASKVGRGTTFRITLPLCEEARRAVEEQAGACAPGGESRVRILVVDDEEFVRELLCDILGESGCETTAARDGAQALALLGAGDFDAVFTDIGMPGMSGWELARLVRERDPEIPLAVITGWGESFSDAQRADARVNWMLTKPFTTDRIDEIVSEVSRLRDGRASREEPAALVA
ncbi:MAG: response regulator [Acidobacteria bacterium]|nr:response regulator [Acidobacteriota bacterium]